MNTKKIICLVFGILLLTAPYAIGITPPALNNPLITQAPQNDPANFFFQFGKLAQNIGQGFNQFAYTLSPGTFVSYQQYQAQNNAYILENEREAYLLTAETLNKTVSPNQFNTTLMQIGSGSNVTLQIFNATALTTQSTISNSTQKQMAQSFIDASISSVNNEDVALNTAVQPIGLTAKAGQVSAPTAKSSAIVARAVISAPKAVSQSVAQSASVTSVSTQSSGSSQASSNPQSGSIINGVFGQGGFFGFH